MFLNDSIFFGESSPKVSLFPRSLAHGTEGVLKTRK